VSDNILNDKATPYRTEASSRVGTLADSIYRRRVERARRAPAEEKILAGQRLFEAACEMTLAGIRNENPGANEERCRAILRDRLKWRREQEKRHDHA